MKDCFRDLPLFGCADAQECIALESSAVFVGDALTVLRKIKSKSVKCAITSPPYWGLRTYGIDEQIGLEETLPLFIDKLVAVFSEVRRVLTDDGTLWLNIGDGYTSGNRGYRAPDKKNPARAMSVRPDTPDGLKPKDLIGVPWRLAFALQDDGWYLRNDIVWNKPNAMPESVRDRPSRCHEYLFMLTKSEKYYYDWQAAREPADHGGFRNRRSVWSINTKPFAGAHFATFPPELIRPCIQISTSPGDFVLDPFFGSGTVGVVCEEEKRNYIGIELNPEYVALAYKRMRKPHEANKESHRASLLLNGVKSLDPDKNLLDDLTLLTLGPQLRGGVNNQRGTAGIIQLFEIIRGIVAHSISDVRNNVMEVTSATGRKVLIEFAPDPDIIIREEMSSDNFRNIVAIEVKSGTDISNIHNRIGEAEKSHQKARKRGFTECWTVINVNRFDLDKAKAESPSTDRFYSLRALQLGDGEEFEDFRRRIVSLTAIISV